MTLHEDADLFMDDFIFQETDASDLSLLEFDPNDILLTPIIESSRSHTHLQQTLFPATVSQFPPSPVTTDDDSTDAEASTSPPADLKQSTNSLQVDTDSTLSPAAEESSLRLFMTMHSPLPSGQNLLASRAHKIISKSSSNITNSSVTSTPINASKSMQSTDKMQPMPALKPFPNALPYAMPVAYFTPSFDANQKRPLAYTLPGTASLSAYESVSSSSSITVAAATSDNSNAKKSKREIR
ncbi:unnamed protein product [Peronospora belbahrii]|uniref:Uncharacterized protein n=1 Tax=Peronospora belbahrii TaxID=622444 RepID=A0AAU9L3J2_9STRA|nr:unnamed protein product [Peronospora belbahrii]